MGSDLIAKSRSIVREFENMLKGDEWVAEVTLEYLSDVLIATALQEAERRGAERMRERAASLCMKGAAYIPTCCSRECYENARVIRALPLEES